MSVFFFYEAFNRVYIWCLSYHLWGRSLQSLGSDCRQKSMVKGCVGLRYPVTLLSVAQIWHNEVCNYFDLSTKLTLVVPVEPYLNSECI